MGTNNGGSNGGNSKRKLMTRGRKRDDVNKISSIGIVARRFSARCGISKQARNGSASNGGRRAGSTVVNKYASRRTSFFKSVRPQKAISQKAGIRSYDSLWDNCQRLFRVGDIVSIVDKENDLPYFAQIRALLSNQLGERFAALTWLAPTKSARNAHEFDDPEQFVHVLADSAMYPLEVCTFVQHAPPLRNYRPEWQLRSLTEKKLREELIERIRLMNTATTKLIAFDEKVPSAGGPQGTV